MSRKSKKGFKMIKLVFGIIDDLSLLPYFLKWYSEQGVDLFIVNIVDFKQDNKIVEEFCDKSRNYNTIINNIRYGKDDNISQSQNRILAQINFTNNNDWIIFADLDEFHEYPGGIERFFKTIDNKYDVVQGNFVDHIALNQKLLPYDCDVDLFKQYPLETRISEKILKVPGARISAIKGFIHTGSMHTCKNKLYRNKNMRFYPNAINIHHFKWREGLIERIEKRLSYFRNIEGSRAVIRESKRLLKYFK